MREGSIIRVERTDIYTEAVQAQFKKNYAELDIKPDGDKHLLFDGSRMLQKERIADIKADLQLFMQNPHIPLENICAHLWNYIPKNPSQVELLNWAKNLMGYNDPREAAGLFMYGEPGVGKSHISLAVTKEIMKQGQEAIFVSADDVLPYFEDKNKIEVKAHTSKSLLETHYLADLKPDQVWVIDDLNNPYSRGMNVFKLIVLNAHNQGGRVFVTSNTSYNKLIESGFVEDEEDRQRFMDRTATIFKILHVTGESNRQRVAWHKIVGNEQLPGLRIALKNAAEAEKYELAAQLRDRIRELEKKKN